MGRKLLADFQIKHRVYKIKRIQSPIECVNTKSFELGFFKLSTIIVFTDVNKIFEHSFPPRFIGKHLERERKFTSRTIR